MYIYIYMWSVPRRVYPSLRSGHFWQTLSFVESREIHFVFFGETTRRIWRTLQWFRVNEPVGRCGVFRSSEMTPVLRVQWSLGHPCFCWSILKFSHTTRRFKGCIVRVCSPFLVAGFQVWKVWFFGIVDHPILTAWSHIILHCVTGLIVTCVGF